MPREPERIPIEDPGPDPWVVDPRDFTTTHQAADGTWYIIRNASSAEANNTLHFEGLRNEGLRLKALLESEDRARDNP